jgi:uncharacterized membrane protein YcaP (DUF421 family)
MPTVVAMNSVWENSLWLAGEVFGGDYPVDPLKLHQVAARAAAVFVIGLAIVRLGKSRLIGRVTALDVILGFILGSLLSRGITGHASISGTAAASATIVFIHWLLTFFACRSHGFGTFIKGHSFPLVKDGEVDQQAMLRSHISPHDLEEEARLRGLETIGEVHLAYKERNGEVSIIGRKKPPKIVDIGVQAGVQTIRIEISS